MFFHRSKFYRENTGYKKIIIDYNIPFLAEYSTNNILFTTIILKTREQRIRLSLSWKKTYSLSAILISAWSLSKS